MGTLRFFEEVVSFKIRRTFGFADYTPSRNRSGRSFFVLSRRTVSGSGFVRRCRTPLRFVSFRLPADGLSETEIRPCRNDLRQGRIQRERAALRYCLVCVAIRSSK